MIIQKSLEAIRRQMSDGNKNLVMVMNKSDRISEKEIQNLEKLLQPFILLLNVRLLAKELFMLILRVDCLAKTSTELRGYRQTKY